jgi:hypothetical protein
LGETPVAKGERVMRFVEGSLIRSLLPVERNVQRVVPPSRMLKVDPIVRLLVISVLPLTVRREDGLVIPMPTFPFPFITILIFSAVLLVVAVGYVSKAI